MCDPVMRNASATSRVDDDVVSHDALQHYLAAQAAMEDRRIKKAVRREWAAAAVGMVWLMVSLGALLVAYAAYV
jgi:hypothetical protein